jgi:hypothetical protein
MIDERINSKSVLAAIYAEKNRRRVIWSASTTLSQMGIERYPHDPPDNRLRMKAVLKGLCDDGHLVQRKYLHSHYTLKEVAYERASK